MLKKYLVIGLCSMVSVAVSGQEGCEHVSSPKALKALEQSKDRDKSAAEKKAAAQKAIELDPECLPCIHQLGEMAFFRAKSGGMDFAEAKELFKSLVEKCDVYHPEPFYYLGAMAYADREYDDAIKYFELFLRFPSDDPTKLGKQYEKKYAEVEEALPHVKAYREIYQNKTPFDPEKVMGVCSDKEEYLPLLSPDGELMFYTRQFQKQAKGDVEPKMVEELTWSKRKNINETFDQGAALPSPFNLGQNYGGITISIDNKEMIVAKKNPKPKNPGNFDLFSTQYIKKVDKDGNKFYEWEEMKDLGPNVNTDNGWEGQPALSGDGNTLVFVTVREGCIKDGSGNPTHDLFYSTKQPDGSWGVAQPMKGAINTKGQEKAPYFHADSKTLYFSSDEHLGVGGMDIFYTKINDDFSCGEIKNIGAPINDENDQIGVIVSSDGELGYFGAKKFRGERTWDIYSFTMPPRAKPEKVMLVKGEVKNKEGEPVSNAEVELKYTESGEVEKVKVNEDDGTYATIMKVGTKEDVVLSVKGDDIAFNTRVIAHKEDTVPPVVVKLDMKTETLEGDKPFAINDIQYGSNKAELMESSFIILKEFAQFLNEHPNMEVEIRGHTDASGSDQANLALSMERAFEVMNFLAKNGVDGKRLSAKGFGETMPIASNDTEDGRSKNRRTEFFVKKL